MSELSHVRELFDRALTVPAAERPVFLSQACSDDPELRRTVERLLEAESQWSLLDSSWSSESAAADEAGPTGFLRLDIGTRLGPYEIVASVDRGGMGEVYQAIDRRLDRQVAIKVLRRDTSRGSRARERFTREAHTIASLSHPSICQLFDVGQAAGTDYLVMEFLEGETLAARLRRGPLPVTEVIHYARQIADGLGAAHRAGVIHRDLKPANVMLTPTGARLLDFGLARVSASGLAIDRKQVAGTLPDRGPFIGTLPYMAPEQLEGADADERTDIFAFGVVLFEALTGRRPFAGDSGAAVITALLGASVPSLAACGVKVPAWLDRVIARCLARSPDDRFQSMHDVQAALAAGQLPRGRWLSTAAALVVVAAGGATWMLWRPQPAVASVAGIRRLTYSGGFKDLPYTDGANVFYAQWKAAFAGTVLFRVPVTGGDAVVVDTPFANPYPYDVTPAGDFLITDRGSRRLHLMSTRDGTDLEIGGIEAGYSDLSADGQRLIVANDRRLIVAARDGSGAHELLRADGDIVLPRWSPDGRRIRYTVAANNNQRRLWEISADGSGLRPLLPGWQAACGVWTADGRHFVFEAERDGEYGLWALAETRWWERPSTPFKLTSGPMRFENPIPSPDGTTLLAIGSPPGGVELSEYDSRTKQFVAAVSGLPITDVEFSPDGAWMAYVWHADGSLWRARADGSDRRQLTFPPRKANMPRWSPEGRRLAFMASDNQGEWRTFVVGIDGGVPTRISVGDAAELDASWAPDGRRLVLSGRPPSGSGHLHVADVVSGHVDTLPGSDGLFSARWSPDGRLIAAISQDFTRLVLYDLQARTWRDVLRGRFGWPHWTKDGQHLQLQNGSDVVRLRVRDGRVETVADLRPVKQALWMQGGGSWLGHTAADVPLVLRDVGMASDVYALRIRWP